MLYKVKGSGNSAAFVPLKQSTLQAQGILEKAMEDWLAANPSAVLPDEERILVIDQETPFQNLTDILAVDSQGETYRY